jgi:hypothetical protein
MRYVRAFGRFWWDFVIGDDWRIAAGVALALGLGAVLVSTGVSNLVVALVTGAAIFTVVSLTFLDSRG